MDSTGAFTSTIHPLWSFHTLLVRALHSSINIYWCTYYNKIQQAQAFRPLTQLSKKVSESTSPTHPLGCFSGWKHGTENSQKSVSPKILRLGHAWTTNELPLLGVPKKTWAISAVEATSGDFIWQLHWYFFAAKKNVGAIWEVAYCWHKRLGQN